LPSAAKKIGASHLTSTHNSLSYFTDLLQLEVHPLTHATTSCFVALSDTNTKKPKNKSSSKLSTMDHFQTLKHQKQNKNFEFK
jgi:hypothetical protein